MGRHWLKLATIGDMGAGAEPRCGSAAGVGGCPGVGNGGYEPSANWKGGWVGGIGVLCNLHKTPAICAYEMVRELCIL